MANFRPIVISLLLVGLFAMALISGGVMLAQKNGAGQSIADDPNIMAYAENLNKTLGNAHSDALSADEAIGSSPVTLTSGFPVFDAISGVWKTIKTVPVTVFNLTFNLLQEHILGSQAFSIVLGVIGAILTITIIFAVWKMVATGEGG